MPMSPDWDCHCHVSESQYGCYRTFLDQHGKAAHLVLLISILIWLCFAFGMRNLGVR